MKPTDDKTEPSVQNLSDDDMLSMGNEPTPQKFNTPARDSVEILRSRRSRYSSSIHFMDIQESSRLLRKHLVEEDVENDPSQRAWARPVVTCLGLILGLVFCFVEIESGNKASSQTLAIAIWMATLWLTEAIPLVVTAFLPLVLFPAFGILSSGTVATQYINNTIWLLIAGFMVALTLERWNLHRRFSLKVLALCGNRPQILLLGMMASTFSLSMFVSNTATTLMMVPNAISICTTLEHSSSKSGSLSPDEIRRYQEKSKRFAIALMLGIAYAANVGGMSSLIGTAPNLVFQSQLELLFPDAPEITFARWLAFGLPTGLILFFIIWIYLCVLYLRSFTKEDRDMVDSSIFRGMYKELGPWSREQVSTCIHFVVLCLLWLFRKDLNFGSFTIPGWSNIFPEPSFISDGTTGMSIACLMFVFPARSRMLAPESEEEVVNKNDEEAPLQKEQEEPIQHLDENAIAPTLNELCDENDTTLLDWETANKMPYDVVFLLGGGFALAKAFVESGLSSFLGDQLAALDISTVGLVFLMLTLIIWLTELTSNTSTSNIMVPIAAAIAVATRVSPYTFMIPAAMACSCAFVLPIATPPNMVVFSTGRLPMVEMTRRESS